MFRLIDITIDIIFFSINWKKLFRSSATCHINDSPNACSRYVCVYLLMLTVAKSSLTILMKSWSKSVVRKMFDGEMLIGTLLTTLLQVFCKIIDNLKVIVKSVIQMQADATIAAGTLKHLWVNPLMLKASFGNCRLKR